MTLHYGYPFSDPHDGVNLYYVPEITERNLSIADYVQCMDALLVRPKAVSAKDIAAGAQLKLIIRGGAGVNAIDLEAAKRRGIIVENTPGQNSVTTAEFAFAMILELLGKRQWNQAHTDVMAGTAMAPDPYCGREIMGKRLAIIGMGNIGKLMIRMALGFGMDVVAYSRSLTPEIAEELGVEFATSLKDAVKDADIISLHTALTDDTRFMINASVLSEMKSEAVIVNTARPALIDTAALRGALLRGAVGGLAVDGDLYHGGEGRENTIAPFADLAKEFSDIPMIITPHIADNTLEAQDKITRQCLDQALAFFVDGAVINRVA